MRRILHEETQIIAHFSFEKTLTPYGIFFLLCLQELCYNYRGVLVKNRKEAQL